jgi:hypothetical protein
MNSSLIARLRARRLLLGSLALLLLAYALAGFFLVPSIARTQIEAFVTEKLQRRIAIGEIRFNPFTLAAEIADLKLTEADGAPLAAFRLLRVNVELASLWRRGAVFKEIELVAPDVEAIVAPDGSLNLARLAPPAAPAPAAEQKADEGLLRVHIGRFAVTEGRVGFQDRSVAQPFSIAFTPIRFSLSDFRTDVGHRNEYSFTAASRVGGRFEWNGGFTVQPLGSSGSFSLADLQLAALDEYLKDMVPTEVVSGTVQLRGTYQFGLQPLSLEVALPQAGVRDLVLAARGVAGAAPVAVPQIDVHNLVVSLARRDVRLRRLDVRGARIDVVREPDGSLNLARLAGPAARTAVAAEPAKPAAPAARPWLVHADTISVEEAAVVLEDRSFSPPGRLRLAPIAVAVNGWSTAPGARMKLETRIGIEKEASLAVSGELGLEPLAAALAIDLQKFPLPALQPHLSRETSLILHSGTLGVKGNLALAAPRAGAAPLARVSGEVRVDNLRATDDLVKEDLLKWRSLVVGGIQFQQGPDRLRIDRIVATEPYARVIIAQNGTTNLARAMTPPAGAKPAPAAAAAPAKAGGQPPPMQMAIKSVQVTEGSANFADYSIQPSFASGIIGLNGQIDGLSSAPESRAKIAIKGRVDEFSPVEIAGTLNLLSAALHTDIALAFRNIELTTFNPYSGKFAGYNIAKGKLSTALKYRVENRKLDAQHHIVVDNLEFGDQTDSKDAAPIPIKLGVALLKDKNGIIEIDLPVSGTLDDPEFRIMPIVWKGIVNLLAKLITAPFKALGALFGGGEDLAFVDFQPGSAALAGEQAKKLETLAKALVERPQLRLNLPLTVATAADSDATARQALRALAPPAEAKPKRLEALEAAYRARVKTAPEYPKEILGSEAPKVDARIEWLEAALLEKLKPTPAALEDLGRQRATAARGALLANKDLNPERVFLVAKPVEAVPEKGLVRMEMKLE